MIYVIDEIDFYFKKISDDDREMFKTMTEDCKKTSKASDADVDNIMDGKIPETQESKCMMTCIMKQFTMVRSIFYCFVYYAN